MKHLRTRAAISGNRRIEAAAPDRECHDSGAACPAQPESRSGCRPREGRDRRLAGRAPGGRDAAARAGHSRRVLGPSANDVKLGRPRRRIRARHGLARGRRYRSGHVRNRVVYPWESQEPRNAAVPKQKSNPRVRCSLRRIGRQSFLRSAHARHTWRPTGARRKTTRWLPREPAQMHSSTRWQSFMARRRPLRMSWLRLW